MKRAPVYDIRTSENAWNTLVALTGVAPQIWERMLLHRSEYRWEDDLVEDVVRRYGQVPPRYEEWTFTYFHITTSADQCSSFQKHGILDLVHSYECKDSELRTFLDGKNIKLDLAGRTLCFGRQTYDISFGGRPPRSDGKARARWAIGRKLYYDFASCGFLSVWAGNPYGGYVHRRPEFLSDIDELLDLTLSEEWHISHKPYEITAVVPGADIVYDGDDEHTDRDKALHYLTKAYTTAFGAPSEEILLLKNGVQIPPDRIIDISPLSCW